MIETAAGNRGASQAGPFDEEFGSFSDAVGRVLRSCAVTDRFGLEVRHEQSEENLGQEIGRST